MKLSKSDYYTQLKDLWFRFTWSDGDMLGSMTSQEVINYERKLK